MSRPASRITQITKATDELLRRIIGWLQDPQGGPIVPENVRIAIHDTAATCGKSSVPESCRRLATVAICRLEEEYRGYTEREHGKIRPENGAPGPSFWGAVAEIARTRHDAEQPLDEQREPVAVLLKQGVSHSQIGAHIYGRRGVGPFIQSNGDINVALIEKEGREPGSVIPEDWVPPWIQEAIDRRKEVLESQLKLFAKMEVARKYDDPATVEELLREGAFVQQIERAKGVTRDEVLEAAGRLGVEAIDGPGYQPHAPEWLNLETFDDDGNEISAVSAADREALKELAVEIYTMSSCQKGSAEIAAELRREGYDINTNTVSAIIGHWKKRHAQGTAGAV